MSMESDLEVVLAFNAALNAADVDGMMARMTADCVFENTEPPPDGERFEGQAAVRACWEFFFSSAVEPHIEVEEIFAAEDDPSDVGLPSSEDRRVVMLWRYSWKDGGGGAGHIRGVDVYRMQGGLIAEKLSYVKG